MDLLPRPDDHEAKMARADLFKLAQYSFKLFKMIHEDQELEGWVQAKITKSADYIASVYHYMEYEMKFSEYGEKLENSDVYSESQKRAIQSMLTEAKATMKKLTAAQAKKLKKKGAKVDEAAKPDFLDMDKDGNKKEPMKKAIKDKKVKEGFPTVADAKARHEKEKGTGKFDKKQISTGTVYTRKAERDVEDDEEAKPKKNKKVKEGGYYDPANDQPQKGSAASQAVAQRAAMAAEQPPKGVNFARDYLEKAASGAPGRWMISADDAKAALAWLAANPNYKPPSSKGVQENDNGRLTFTRTPDGKTSVKSSTGRIQATIDKDKTTYAPGKPQGQRSTQPLPPGTTPEEAKKDPRYKTDPDFKKEVDAAMQIGVNEASKRAKKDYDKDGKIESGKDEYLGSKIRAAKKAGKMEEAAKCNHTSKGKSCPVHGLKECGGMYESGKPSAGLSAAKKSSIVKKAKAGGDIGKPGKSFDKVAAKAGGGEKGKKIAAAAMWKNAAR